MTSILLLTPLVGMVAAQAPLQPPALALGLAVFACMPTALSSGVAFTQQIGGNVALALLLTVGSNMLVSAPAARPARPSAAAGQLLLGEPLITPPCPAGIGHSTQNPPPQKKLPEAPPGHPGHPVGQ
jgi:hypothetical protein